MKREDLKFVITIDKDGVRTTPKMTQVEARLSLLARGFEDAKPWKLVLDSTGKIIERVGFDAERLQIGAIIGPAVCEFARSLDPRIFDAVDDLVHMLAKNPMSLPLDEIDWNNVDFDFIPLRAMETEGMHLFMMLGRQFLSMPLPGAERGAFQNDANGFIRKYFLDQLAQAQRAEIPHEAIALAAGMAKLQSRCRKMGVSLPDMSGFVGQLESLMEKCNALSPRDRESRVAWEAEYNQAMAGYFGTQFPELALPPKADGASASAAEQSSAPV